MNENLNTIFTNTAIALKSKDSSISKVKPSEFADKITNLPTDTKYKYSNIHHEGFESSGWNRNGYIIAEGVTNELPEILATDKDIFADNNIKNEYSNIDITNGYNFSYDITDFAILKDDLAIVSADKLNFVRVIDNNITLNSYTTNAKGGNNTSDSRLEEGEVFDTDKEYRKIQESKFLKDSNYLYVLYFIDEYYSTPRGNGSSANLIKVNIDTLTIEKKVMFNNDVKYKYMPILEFIDDNIQVTYITIINDTNYKNVYTFNKNLESQGDLNSIQVSDFEVMTGSMVPINNYYFNYMSYNRCAYIFDKDLNFLGSTLDNYQVYRDSSDSSKFYVYKLKGDGIYSLYLNNEGNIDETKFIIENKICDINLDIIDLYKLSAYLNLNKGFMYGSKNNKNVVFNSEGKLIGDIKILVPTDLYSKCTVYLKKEALSKNLNEIVDFREYTREDINGEYVYTDIDTSQNGYVRIYKPSQYHWSQYLYIAPVIDMNSNEEDGMMEESYGYQLLTSNYLYYNHRLYELKKQRYIGDVLSPLDKFEVD